VLDLHQRRFEGRRLRPDELVIGADEQSPLHALGRRHETVPPRPGRAALVETKYRRRGTLGFLAAWDVHDASLFDRVEPKTGIEPFGRLVEQVMTSEPYASARTVYWFVDNGSSHAGRASIERLEATWQNLWLIHLPIRASWLNQIERSSRSPSAKRSAPTASTRLMSSPIGCWASASTTARSPDRSTGPSPAPTWSACSPRSASASHGLRSRRNGPKLRGFLAAQGCCQRALTIFHPSRVRTRCRYST
jgi:hypothetical protein